MEDLKSMLETLKGIVAQLESHVGEEAPEDESMEVEAEEAAPEAPSGSDGFGSKKSLMVAKMRHALSKK